MAEIPSFWNKTFEKLNIHKTTCNNFNDVIKYMVEHKYMNNHKYGYRNLDGVVYTVESTDDLTICHSNNVVFNFTSDNKCKLALYIDKTIVYEDCTNLSMEHGINMSAIPFSVVKIVPEFSTKISYQSVVLDTKIIQNLNSQQFVTIKKGTVLKRLQNPEVPIGEYFTYEHAYLDKCGVSRYYTSKYGFEEEKKILKFRARQDFSCETKKTVDAIDNWSSNIPYNCKGGEDILYIRFSSTLGDYLEQI